MRVAITGASGLIGTALASSLEGDGHTVIRVRRSGANELVWEEAADAVVHLAGASIGGGRWTEARKQLIYDSRVKLTAQLAGLLAELETPPSVLVSGSAVGYYGDRGDDVLIETSGPGEGFLAGVTVDWEAAAAPAAEAGIRVVHPRTGIVLDRSAPALRRMLPAFRFFVGGPFGSGAQWWSWITLADTVAALRFLIDNDVSGPANLTAPNPVTNKDFADAVGKALHRPARLPVPRFGPALLFGGELVDELLLASTRALPDVLENTGFEFADPELEPALAGML